MFAFKTLDDLDVQGRKVLVRADLNVPMRDGNVSDTTRIDRSLPTLNDLLDKGAKVIVVSHFGCPKGQAVPEMSMKPISAALEKTIGSDSLEVMRKTVDELLPQFTANARVLYENFMRIVRTKETA